MWLLLMSVSTVSKLKPTLYVEMKIFIRQRIVAAPQKFQWHALVPIFALPRCRHSPCKWQLAPLYWNRVRVFQQMYYCNITRHKQLCLTEHQTSCLTRLLFVTIQLHQTLQIWMSMIQRMHSLMLMWPSLQTWTSISIMELIEKMLMIPYK